MMKSTPSGDAEPQTYESGGCVQVDVYAGEHLAEPLVRVRSTNTGTVMQMRITEWRAFVAQVKAGDWNHVDTDFEFAVARDQAELPVVVVYNAA